MIYYGDNKVYTLYAETYNYALLANPLTLPLSLFEDTANDGAFIEIMRHKLSTSAYINNEHDAIIVKFNGEALQCIHKYIVNPDIYDIHDFAIIIWDGGFISVRYIYKNIEEIELDIFDKDEPEYFDDKNVFSILKKILNMLAKKKIITYSKEYSFGIPCFLTNIINDPTIIDENDYMYNQHFFLTGTDIKYSDYLKNRYNIVSNNISIDNWKFFSGWSLYLWESEEECILNIDILDCDTIHLALTLLCTASMYWHSKILEYSKNKIVPDDVRYIINHDNRILQNIYLYNHAMRDCQYNVVNLQNEIAKNDERISMLRYSIQSLQTLAEGIESKKNRKSANFIENILFAFTIASIYSVFYGYHEFVTTLHNMENFMAFVWATMSNLLPLILMVMIFFMVRKKH